METKQPKLMKSRAEVAFVAFAIVMSVAANSAVLAQDSSKPATPPAAEKPAATDKMDMDKMDMAKDGHGMMGMGMKSGMQQMKCCGKGMGQSDRGASGQDERK